MTFIDEQLLLCSLCGHQLRRVEGLTRRATGSALVCSDGMYDEPARHRTSVLPIPPECLGLEPLFLRLRGRDYVTR
jgi:hypothetical protein